ncbi:hypothetical protein BWQ96_07604 [Gracilariopsis chorda]|uniref:Uncharacterized protein n=1 Tax=Gracilariopsis chorda TaxID=448386 RepID=A0A2V3IKQ7_9FLOR|nr:hypothetical protein BWQ96_07604 [Gracilariopsis chorda]|eukprot:PXF42661.1 hypothetical protein BWQ96_07604 [Gracilariopsis chorda]
MPRAMRAQPNLLLAKIAEHKRIPGILIETEFANHLATEPSFESRAAHDGHVVSFSSAYMAKLGGPWLFVLLGALSGYGGVQIRPHLGARFTASVQRRQPQAAV